jgi:CO dehydrogenase/acetyl-CoA synthase beta subunit
MVTRAEGETPGCRTEEGPRAADAKGKELLQSSAPPVETAAAEEEEEEEEQQQQQHHHHHQNGHDMHSKEVSTINISELAVADNVSVYVYV